MPADAAIGAETRGLTKAFAGREVLRGVNLQIRAGAIHALLGANGSGKSTIVKLLTGVYQPDAGVIAIGGREVGAIASPHAASSLGVAVVHQEAPLINSFSVAECIAQFRGYPTQAGRIQWARLNREVRHGEIVGVAGLSDSGVAELPKILAGLQAPTGGQISVGGKVVASPAAPRAMFRAGIAVLPADRLRSGGVASFSVAENVLLPDLARFWLKPRRESKFIERTVRLFDVRPATPGTLFGKLSGGNQQKAILTKWLALKP